MVENFLCEEVRADFLVDIDRKRLWKTELNMMIEFDAICKKHDLKYFILGGALIGAVRHKGFIPWDDDIDIGMLRADFEKFLEVAKTELDSKKYFVQEGLNDEGYFDVIVRIRDNETTGICRYDVDSKCHNGIFIEIYPFDSVNPNKFLYKKQKLEIAILKSVLFNSVYKYDDSFFGKCKRVLSAAVLGIWSKEKVFNRMNAVASKYNDRNFEYVDELLTKYNCCYKKSDLEETINVPFEYLMLSIPKGYDNCLKTTYGNYMELPPVEKRQMHHNRVVYYDSTKPYTDKNVIEKARKYFEGE